MYTEADIREVRRRILRDRALWLSVTALMLLPGLFGLVRRIVGLFYLSIAMAVVAAIFGLLYIQRPWLEYLRFLTDMRAGLTRELSGTVVNISQVPTLRDGARVLPVHLQLDEGGEERIVYLNVSKGDRFPGVGGHVFLKLCGRHIREVCDS